MRARRWLRGLRSVGLFLLVAAVPVLVGVIFAGGDDPAGSASVPQPAQVLVRTFSESGSTSTGVFVVSSNWLLKWQLDGLASDSIRIVVREAGGSDLETIEQEGLGSGEQTFAAGGAYRLVVTSTGDWSITVLQLSNPIAD